MLRSCRILRQSLQQEGHRYAQATFHEGTHRQAPGDSTPWRDASSPINRFKGWWLAPAAKGSVIAAWCITMVLGTYCFSIQQDAKGTYLLNNVLLRNLHEETQRADANQLRANELQEALRQHLSQGSKKRKRDEKVEQLLRSTDTVKETLVNYELEVTRERMRADETHARNQDLVEELTRLRQHIAQLESEAQKQNIEMDKLLKLVKRSSL